MKEKIRFFLKIILILIVLAVISILISNKLIEKASQNKLFDSTEIIPQNKVALLLGTGKYTQGKYINLYYKYRIEATIKLYESGKINFILISGDNSRKEYDEPNTMKQDLMEKGIPEDKIYLDYAGFRTLDSVVRCKEIFNQSKITIISQKFHNQRAIFIAQHYNIDAIGFNAQDVSVYWGFKTRMREHLARVKVMIDLLIGKQPKFLGEKINIK